MRTWLSQTVCTCLVIGVVSDAGRPFFASTLQFKPKVKAGQNPRRKLPLPDGRTRNRSLELEMERGKTLQLALGPGLPCFVELYVRFPSRIELELTGPSVGSELNPQLRVIGTTPHVTIPGTVSAHGNQNHIVHRMSYVLVPKRLHVLQIGNDKAAESNSTIKPKPTHLLKVTDIVDVTEPLMLLKGNQTSVRLDPVSRVTVRRLVVESAVLVSFSVAGAAQKGRPLRIQVNSPNEPEAAWTGNIPLAESNSAEDGRRSASFILTPGVYFLEIESSANSSPAPLLEAPLRSATFILSVDEKIDRVLPDSLKAVETWLKEVGLDRVLEVIEFADLRDGERGLPRAAQRLTRFAIEAAYSAPSIRLTEEQIKARLGILDREKLTWPRELKETDRPSFVVSIRPKINRHNLDDTETAFLKAQGSSIWDRVFQKISALERLSARRIVAYVPVWCSAMVAYLGKGHTVQRYGSECTSESASAPLIPTRDVASSANSTLKQVPRSLDGASQPFLAAFMAPAPAEFEFLTVEADFVEVIVRGLRGQVVNGGANWERLQLTIAVTGGAKTSQPTLRVSVDGRIASGLGGYPPDSQFTRDMEPQYSMNLTEYAKKLATALRDELMKNQ